MAYVIAAPEMMTAAATDLATIGSDLSAAHTATALPTAAVIPAAADEVSASIAHLFSQYAGGFQALAGQAAAFHAQFVQALTAGARAYASSEAANAGPLNVAVSVLGRTLVQSGTAHASGWLAVAVGANSDASTLGLFNSAFALGAGSDAAATGGFLLSGAGFFNTAIAIGTNDVAKAGPTEFFFGSVPGSFNTAFVLGNGSTANAGPSGGFGGNFCLAAVLGNMLTATATGDLFKNNFMRDIMTPFGTL